MEPSIKNAFTPTGTLRASINVGNPILARRNPNLGAEGVSVDMANALARDLGLTLELVIFDSAGDSVNAVIGEQADIGFFAVDPKRGEEIAFTEPYVLIEGYFLVPENSFIVRNEDVDRSSNRIAVGKGSAYDLYLQRTIKQASLVQVPTSPAVFSFFVEKNLEVAAGVKQQLEQDLPRFPGHRLLGERFMVIRQAMGISKTRGEVASQILTEFVERQKQNGFVSDALQRHAIDGAMVAPLKTEDYSCGSN
jgi:polar amino acid transport system substrate-binding protein